MKRKFSYKALLLALLALLICLSAVVLSVAYLKQQTGAVTNTFVRGEDPTLTYRLVYDLNGGTGDPIKSEAVEATEEEHTFTVTSEEPSRLGYQFLGWADTADAKAPTYYGGNTITVTKDDPGRTLYAVWQEVDDFVLYFQSNLPDSVKNVKLRNMPETMTAKYAGSSQHTFTVTNVPYDENADATGLTFLGWTTVEGGTVIYPTDDTIDVTVTQKTTVLYAVWGYEYFVKFDRNPGDGTVGKYNRADGALVNEVPADQILLSSDSKTVSPYLLYESGEYSYVRTGYLLVGFSSEADGATPEEYVTVAKPGRNNAKTVYAIWAQGNYALIYDANGGSNAPATQTATAGELSYTFTISTKIPDRMEGSNGVFKGWAYTADAETPDFVWNGSAFTPASVTLEIDKPVRVLYAVWEYTYTLTYQRGLADANSSMPEKQTAKSTSPTYSFTIPKEPTPTRGAEYLFHYWSYGEERQAGEFRYCDVANYFDKLTLTATDPSAELYPRFRPTNGYNIVFKELKDGNGNEDTTVTITSTTETFCSYTIPAWADYKENRNYSDMTFLGWSETYDINNLDPDYKIGDVVTINPDTDTHTKVLYPVYRLWDCFTIYIDYNGGRGSYEKPDGCGGHETVYVDSYSSNMRYSLTPGQTKYTISTFTANNFYSPSLSGHKLNGFNYRNNGTEALFNETNIPNAGACQDKDTNTLTLNNVVFDLSKAGTEQTIDFETYGRGQRSYRLTLYAVWAKNNAYDKYQLILSANGSGADSGRTFEKELLQTDPAYEVTFETTKNNTSISRTGYKLTGFAYDQEGNEPCATYKDGYLDKDIVVSQSDTAHVVTDSGGGREGGDRFWLRLYAMWEQQQVFDLKLDYNGGYYKYSSTKSYYSEQRQVTRPPEETSYTWTSGSAFYVPSRYGYVFKGFAYSKDATEPDFIMTGGKFPSGITIDKSDTEHVVFGTVNDAPATSLTLYAVWEKQQIFYLRQDFNGGSYKNSNVTYTEWTREVVAAPNLDFYEFSDVSVNSNYAPSRSGYTLLGYAYQKDATVPDFVCDSTGKTVTPPIPVSRLDEDPEHVVSHTDTSDGVPKTELTVYAVWQKNKEFRLVINPNNGTASTTLSQQVDPSVTQATWTTETSIAVPSRSNYEFLGFATKAGATEAEFTLKDTYYDNGYKAYFAQDITFSDMQDGVIHETSSAPETHTLTIYGVWKPLRQFSVSIIRNNTSYTTYSGSFDKTVTSAVVAVTDKNNKAIFNDSDYYFKGASYVQNAKVPDFAGFAFDVPVDMDDTERVTVSKDAGGAETVTLRLYATLSAKLSYSGRFGTDFPESTEIISPTADDCTAQIANARPTYNGFLFAGWATTNDASVPEYGAEGYYTKIGIEVSPTFTLQKNTTLYAVWVQKYTLGYDANKGDQNSTPPFEETYITLKTTATSNTFNIGPQKPYREGYNFLGWSKDPNATAATYQPGGTILVNGNTDGSETVTTLYAVWQEDTGETTADETTETDGPLLNGSGSPTSPSEKLE